MFSLENLKVLVKKELVSLEVLVGSYLSLCVICGVDQVVQNYLFAVLVSLTLTLFLQNFKNCLLCAETGPEDNFKIVKH